MRKSRWTRNLGMGATLLFLAALLGSFIMAGDRAWSFSVQVPVDMATLTGSPGIGPPRPSESPAASSTGSDANPTPGSGVSTAPNAPSPGTSTAAPATAAPGAPQPSPTDSATRHTSSNWPAIILGTVCALGGLLIVLYFVSRRAE